MILWSFFRSPFFVQWGDAPLHPRLCAYLPRSFIHLLFEHFVVQTTSLPLACPANIVIGTDSGVCNAVATYSPAVSDNCAATTTLSLGLSSGSAFPLGLTMNQIVAQDAAGNSANCQFSVTVFDDENPLIGNRRFDFYL